MAATTAPPVVGLILNYRDSERTLRCIDSLQAEGLEEILVWDNSEDGDASLADLQQRLRERSGVDNATEHRNLGFAAGVNRGIARITAQHPGSWVLLINNDAGLLPGGLKHLITALQARTGAAIAYPDIDHGGHLIGTVYYQRWLGLITYRPLPDSFAYASGCCQLIAPERLNSPCFDERYFMYGEDMEQGFRLGPEGMAHVPVTCVRHEGSASSGMGSPFYETRMVAAHWLLARQLAEGPWSRFAMYAGRVASLTLRALARSRRFRSLLPLRALWRGWRISREHR